MCSVVIIRAYPLYQYHSAIESLPVNQYVVVLVGSHLKIKPRFTTIHSGDPMSMSLGICHTGGGFRGAYAAPPPPLILQAWLFFVINTIVQLTIQSWIWAPDAGKTLFGTLIFIFCAPSASVQQNFIFVCAFGVHMGRGVRPCHTYGIPPIEGKPACMAIRTSNTHKICDGIFPLFRQEFASGYWLQKGAPRHKMNVGLALYGRTFTLRDPATSGVGAPSSGGGQAGPFTREPGYLAYHEVSITTFSSLQITWRVYQLRRLL